MHLQTDPPSCVDLTLKKIVKKKENFRSMILSRFVIATPKGGIDRVAMTSSFDSKHVPNELLYLDDFKSIHQPPPYSLHVSIFKACFQCLSV